MYTNINGFWRKANGVFINISGYWRKVNSAFVNISGAWRSFFVSEMSTSSPATISLSINNSTYLATLTGRTYSWVPGPPTLNYVFQWSDDGGTFWTTISSASAINPAYGSYNEYTYALSASGPTLYVSPNILNLYKFRINAVNGSLSGSSTSSTVSIQGPTNIVLSYVSATSTSVDLSWTSSTGANRYMVYYSTNNSVFTLFAGTSLTSVTVTGLTLATLYYFKVIPITGSSNNTGYYGNYSNTISQSTLTPPYTVTYNMINGGTVSPTSATVNAGSSVILPTPTLAGYTFNGWYDTSSGSYTYGGPTNGAAGVSFTPPSSIIMYARWIITPVIPTITMGANSGVTTTSGTINWTSTNQASFSSSGTISGTGNPDTTTRSVTNNSLSPGTTYTGTVTVTSSTGNTASANYSLTTSTGSALTPTFGANTSTADGFTGSVTNYNSAYTWNTPSNGSFTLTNGTWTWGVASGSTRPFTVTGLSSSQSSTATVNTTRTGYTSGSASTTGTASAALFAPSAPSPSVTSGPTQTTATVSWSAPSNGGSAITSYEAQLGSSGYVNIGNVLSSSISGLIASTSYTYYVRAINAIGTSPAGSVSFTTLAAAPTVITAPTLSASSAYLTHAISVTDGTWANSPTSYTYQWRNNNGIITGATSNVYSPQGSDYAATLLTCTVTATNAGGSASSTPSAVSIFISGALTTTGASNVYTFNDSVVQTVTYYYGVSANGGAAPTATLPTQGSTSFTISWGSTAAGGSGGPVASVSVGTATRKISFVAVITDSSSKKYFALHTGTAATPFTTG